MQVGLESGLPSKSIIKTNNKTNMHQTDQQKSFFKIDGILRAVNRIPPPFTWYKLMHMLTGTDLGFLL